MCPGVTTIDLAIFCRFDVLIGVGVTSIAKLITNEHIYENL